MAFTEDEKLHITYGRRNFKEAVYNVFFSAGLLAITSFDLLLWVFNRRLE